VRLSHPDRLIYPELDISKRDLAESQTWKPLAPS
jgi:DNA primase